MPAEREYPSVACEAAHLTQFMSPGDAATAKAIFSHCVKGWPEDRAAQERTLNLIIRTLYIGGYIAGIRRERRTKRKD